MKILFVVPRSLNVKQMYKEYPLGVGILATLCKKNSYEIKIYDGNVETEDVESFVSSFNPNVIAYSIMTPNYIIAKNEVKKFRNIYSDIIYIAGGIHATLFPELLLDDGFDIVCLGEGENRFINIINCIVNNVSLKHIDGVFSNFKGEMIDNKALSNEKVNITELPFVDRNIYNLSMYTHHSLVTSRGCPYSCNFCCNYSGTILQSGVSICPVERVLDELEYLETKFNAKNVFFADDIFFLKKSEIIKFCVEYNQRKLKVEWNGQMRADMVDKEVVASMANAGCQKIYFGVESGSEKILKEANKQLTKSQIRNAIMLTKEAGIRVKTGWIYGLPGTLGQQYESIDFMRELKPHEISIHQLIPFPGTIYYEKPHLFGIQIVDKFDFKSFCYGGISDNVKFDYLTNEQLIKLYKDTAKALEDIGYINSDTATVENEYIYSTPLSKNIMLEFNEV